MENQNEMDTYYKGDNNATAFSMRTRSREYWEAATKGTRNWIRLRSGCQNRFKPAIATTAEDTKKLS